MIKSTNNEINEVKIIDFGLSSKIELRIVTGTVGTPIYFAPEIIFGENYSNVIYIF